MTNVETDGDMIKKILQKECGSSADDKRGQLPKRKKAKDESDEFAADEMELAAIGKSEYFSTCEYKMISGDDNLTGQGS